MLLFKSKNHGLSEGSTADITDPEKADAASGPAEDASDPVTSDLSDQACQKKFWMEVLDMVVYLAFVVVLCLLFIRFVAVRTVVDGNSMNPLVSDRDNIIVEKVSYYFKDPERFDVIVFELSSEPGVHYIKRIIGLPGETVQILDGFVYVNGEKLETDVYGKEIMKDAYTAASPIVLGDDEFFVLGDNRNHSQDSRSVHVGKVRRSQFLGRAWFRFWPIRDMCLVNRK